jgi:hypothetical protein
MASTINASTAGVGGVITTADNTGILNIQSGGSTKIAVTSAGVAVTGLSKGSLPTGSVLQVVHSAYDTRISTTSSTFSDTGITATITPTSATSKILVIANIPYASRGGAINAMLGLNLCRNGTQIEIVVDYVGYIGGTSYELGFSTGFSYYDAPASTSALVYKIQYRTYSGTTILQENNTPSTITLMEIAA